MAGVVFLVIIIFILYLSREKYVAMVNFLPESTIFYWHEAKDVQNDLSWLKEQKILDNQALDEHENLLRNILGDDYKSIRENFWFKTDKNPEANGFLIRTSGPAKPMLKKLNANKDEFFYKQLSNNILLISDQAALLGLVPKDPKGSLPDEALDRGVYIYWRTNKVWPMLEPLAGWLNSFIDGQDIYFNTYNNNNRRIVKIWQPQAILHGTISDRPSYEQVRLPINFDLALGFQKASSENTNFIKNYLVSPVFKSLPYDAISSSKQPLLPDGGLLIQNGDDWLLAGPNDWQTQLVDLASQLDVVEKAKVLSDGTRYTELVAKDGVISKHQFRDQEYWQFDSIFGWKLNNTYYLANSQPWLEGLIIQDSTMGQWWIDCDGSNIPKITDFVLWHVDKLPESQIKTYLNSKNINFLSFFDFFNQDIHGLQLCLSK